ncbi:MAG: DUF493 family protein [Neisseriales bacterium]|nr:MAG: DUF493 family protein [Neisseriales bacterium]
MATHANELLQFPCVFVIKVVVRYQDDIIQTLLDVIQQYAPHTTAHHIKTRPSRASQYIGLSITIQATSRLQLDSLYQALTAHSCVRFVL